MKSKILYTLLLCFIGISQLQAAGVPYTVVVTKSKTYDALPTSGTTVIATNKPLVPKAVPIGFNFRFFGQMQDQVYVNGNGQLSFTNFKSADFIDAIGTTLQPIGVSQIAYGVIGASPSRIFIIEWKNMNVKTAADTTQLTTFHVEFHETSGVISMMYNLAPKNNNENWYQDQNGALQEIADIVGESDVVYGNDVNAPTASPNHAIKYGYSIVFPKPGTEYAFTYQKPAGAPFIKIKTPVTGITINTGPSIPILWTSDSAALVTIQYSVSGGTTWTTEKMHLLSGKTPYMWTPTFTYSANTQIKIIDEGSSVVATTGSFKVDFGSGIDNAFNTNATIKLYPNPSTGNATIDLTALDNASRNGIITVSNTVGQVVYTRSLKEEAGNTLELTNLRKGLYIVELVTEGERFTNKLVVD